MTNPGSKQIKIRYAVYSRLMKQKGNSLSEKVENLLNNLDGDKTSPTKESKTLSPEEFDHFWKQMEPKVDVLFSRMQTILIADIMGQVQNKIDNSIEDAKRNR